MDEKLADEFLDASRIRPGENIFSIGPFGHTVSFATQQARAFNLVCALKQIGTIKEGSKVAVVGAGLSGMTAAMCLVGYSCIVRVYEKDPVVLGRQKDSVHRILHPTISYWPEVSVNHTTRFPFADWFLNECSSVVRDLSDIWEKSVVGSVSTAYMLTEVKDVKKIPHTEEISVLSYGHHSKFNSHDPGDAVSKEHNFDVVILATGFGEEKDVEFSNSKKTYWQTDELDLHRKLPKFKEFIVSGDGDGGVIECLRLTHDHFDKGRLTLKFAKAVSRDPAFAHIKRKIVNAEKIARDSLKNSRLGVPTNPKVLIALQQAYMEAVDVMSADSMEVVESLYSSKGKVFLVSPNVSPFNVRTAPVHKLMLALALKNSIVTHQFGKIVGNSDKIEKVLYKEDRSVEQTIQLDQSEQYYVARIGPKFPLKEYDFMSDEELLALETRQTLKDSHILSCEVLDELRKVISEKFPAFPCLNQNPNDFYFSRESQINKFCSENYECSHPSFEYCDDREEYYLLIDERSCNDSKLASIGGPSEDIFGLPMKMGSLTDCQSGTEYINP